ncbi:glycyl-tRNA ligase subunit beta [Alcaligenes faecalis subsp. faecalis NCIB 8687]|nr:glycyl-tRNA ligase subunit beta [Alcaligenes faecalis subsp. faecalis NCIB 8687]
MTGDPAEPTRLLNLDTLLNTTASFFKDGVLAADTVDAVQTFIYERYRNQLSNDYERSVVDARAGADSRRS